jgi:hypothetical protein
MATNHKQRTTMTVTGLHMTEARQAQVGQAILIRLAQQLDGEIDGVTITFTLEEQ